MTSYDFFDLLAEKSEVEKGEAWFTNLDLN